MTVLHARDARSHDRECECVCVCVLYARTSMITMEANFSEMSNLTVF